MHSGSDLDRDPTVVAMLIGDAATFRNLALDTDAKPLLIEATRYLIGADRARAAHEFGGILAQRAHEAAEAEQAGNAAGQNEAAMAMGQVLGVIDVAAGDEKAPSRFADVVVATALDLVTLGVPWELGKALVKGVGNGGWTSKTEPTHDKLQLFAVTGAAYDREHDPHGDVRRLDADDPERLTYQRRRESFELQISNSMGLAER